MSKANNNNIPSMEVDWGSGPDGRPYSGGSVLRFIKDTFNSKVGTALFDSNASMLYLFKDIESKNAYLEDPTIQGLILDSVLFSFESKMRRIRVDHGNTVINATVNQESIPLEMDVYSEEKEYNELNWEPTGHDIDVKVFIDINTTNEFHEIVELELTILQSNPHLSIDVKPYTPTGSHRIRIYFYDKEISGLTTSITYNVTLTLMYIEPWSNDWFKALVETGNQSNYHLGGFRIVGNIPKTLHIEINTAVACVNSYEIPLNFTQYIDSPYYFTREDGLDFTNPKSKSGENLHPLSSGVYNVKVWLTSDNITTIDNALQYNIMYVAAGDENTVLLVAMNDSGHVVNNYDESAFLCNYAVYNCNQSYATPTISITPYLDGSPSASDSVVFDTQVLTLTLLVLNYPINLVTNTENLGVFYRVELGLSRAQGYSPVSNTLIFPSTEGVTFYLNPSIRSNGESLKETIYNNAQGQVAVPGTSWQKMSWVNEFDGWTTDGSGRKCLLLPARTRLKLSKDSFYSMPGLNVTYELCFKVSNVSDYNENIITIGENFSQSNFTGIRIKPTNVTIHYVNLTDGQDIYLGTNFCDELVIHLMITISGAYKGNSNYKYVTGYINGTTAFEFSYDADRWSDFNSEITFGSDTADLSLYMFRFYGYRALTSGEVENNWLNSLETRNEKVLYRNFIDSIFGIGGSRKIDYETIKNEGKYNFFVVLMVSGAEHVPSTSYPAGGTSNIEMHYGLDKNGNSRSLWDWKIYDVETTGQGTTSMSYWKWNIRWRIDKSHNTDKKCDVSYYDTPTVINNLRIFHELDSLYIGTVCFDGQNNHPNVKRITAKINFASSMQSHKMGATKAYEALHDSIDFGAMLNESQLDAVLNNDPLPSVAVYQYPAFGFEKTVNEITGLEGYEFIGLFTIGPDKGDKPTFGYDRSSVKNELITLEGKDHTPQMALFSVPWDALTVYNSDLECLSTKLSSQNFDDAIEVSNAKTADTGNAEETMAVLVDSFKDAYSVIYDNSTLIFPISLDDVTFGGADALTVLNNINSNVQDFKNTMYNNRLKYENMQFWIQGEYILYHLESESSTYVSGYKSEVTGLYDNPLDLRVDTGITDLDLTGLTLELLNNLFKQARIERFLREAPDYWDMDELVFNFVFLVIFGATDNFAKNQYPYYMGNKWRFRQDDLDTIIDIDNNGGQTKPSDIEFLDDINGTPYFAGSNSVLWNLVYEGMQDDIKSMGKKMIIQMSTLASGNNYYDGFMKFFEKYFWENALKYFPLSAYNIDADFKYNGAWTAIDPVTDQPYSFLVWPLQLSLGSHYYAELLWARRRAVYCMSLFLVGPFSNNDEQYFGRMQFRPQSLPSITVTPAETLYPCFIIGDNTLRPTGRTFEGEQYTFDNLPTGSGETAFTLLAVDYLTSFGNLKDLLLGYQDSELKISGKKIRDITISDELNEVTGIPKLNISSSMPCLEIVDIRNASSITGPLNLNGCNRIKEVYTNGSSIESVSLPQGSKIEKLYLADTVTTLEYKTIRYLLELVLPSDPSIITHVLLEACDMLDGMETIETIYQLNDQQLSFIDIFRSGEINVTGSQIRMLSHIKQNLDKDGNYHAYGGYDQSDNASIYVNPRIECNLVLDKYYMSDLTQLIEGQVPQDSTEHPGYKQAYVPYFGALNITYPLGDTHEYIEFVDPVVKQICATEWGDGTGILKHEAEDVTTIVDKFNGNTQITSFKELRNFTGLTHSNGRNSALYRAFINCTNLEYIDFPKTSIIAPTYSYWFNYTCYGCTNLKRIYWPYENGVLCQYMFNGCTNLKHVDIDSLEQWAKNLFGDYSSSYCRHPFDASHEGHLYLDGVEITNYVIPGAITQIKNGNFRYCTGLTGVDIPSSVTSIGSEAFRYCNNLAAVIIRATTPPTLSNSNAFGSNATGRKFYVPNGCKNAYTTASAWSSFSEDTFIELDENGNIPT